MNQKILDAAAKLERIHNDATGFLSIVTVKKIEFSKEDIASIYHNARKDLLQDLKKFFIEENRDDFVTLFGIYCNFYIKQNYHQILPEQDFGVSELWEVITDENFQKYLLLIQQGIDRQQENFFVDALKMFEEYSIPHLYRFIFSAVNFDSAKASEEKDICIKSMQEHYNKMTLGMREYVLGTKFMSENNNPALDGNPLPYVKAIDRKQDIVFDVTKALINSPPVTNGSEIQFALAGIDRQWELLKKIFNSGDIVYEDNRKPEWRESFGVAFRVAYLNIPVKISNTGSFLLDQMEKLRFKSQRDDLIADFTHTCKNLNATNLGEIAESLLKMESEQEKNWGRDLLLEFARKDTLNKKVTMLNMRYEGDSNKLVDILEDNLSDEVNGIDILEVLQVTALNCFVEIFYDKGENPDVPAMRKRAHKLWKDFAAKKISFEKEVIFNQKNCIDWMTENGFRLSIKTDKRWKKIYLKQNGYAEVFLRDIFLEMLINFLKYGEVTEPAEIDLLSDESTLKVSMRNLIAPKRTNDFAKSTRRGLLAMNNTLESLYIGKGLNVPEKCVRSFNNANFFVVELLLPEGIFLKGGR